MSAPATHERTACRDVKCGIASIRRWISSTIELQTGANRITPIEGMRGYAVLLVFFVHHHNLFGGYLPSGHFVYFLSQFGNAIGHSGVDLFFLLSGFLIYGHLLRKPISYFSFCNRRVHRIYPTFMCVFCLYVLFSYLFPTVSKTPASFSTEIIYLTENFFLLPGIFDIPALVTVAWSLSYEFFFYLSIPLVISLTGMRGWSRPERVVFFVSLLLAHYLGCWFGMLPHIRLSMFLAGILLYELAESRRITTRLSISGEIVMLAAYLVVLVALGISKVASLGGPVDLQVPTYPSVIWPAMLWLALFGLSQYCLIYDGVLRYLFGLTPLRWLGNMSYSYFLLHGLVLNGVAFLLHYAIPAGVKSVPFFLVLFVTNFLLALSCSFILFAFVEKPFSLARKPLLIIDKRRQRPSVAVKEAGL